MPGSLVTCGDALNGHLKCIFSVRRLPLVVVILRGRADYPRTFLAVLRPEARSSRTAAGIAVTALTTRACLGVLRAEADDGQLRNPIPEVLPNMPAL